jgi:hypothetical protein
MFTREFTAACLGFRECTCTGAEIELRVLPPFIAHLATGTNIKDGRVLSTAHRGEQSGNHAEFVALEKKLSDEAVAGATVYTTLEP